MVLMVVETSNLLYIVPYKKGKQFVSFKVKAKVKFKGSKVKITFFGHKSVSICLRDFQLVAYCSL